MTAVQLIFQSSLNIRIQKAEAQRWALAFLTGKIVQKSDESEVFVSWIKNPNEVFAPTGVKHLRNMRWETGQERGNEQLCEISAFCSRASGTHDTKQLPYFVQQLVAFQNSSFWCFFPQLQINMDWRQNCLIDLRFSRYSFCNISLSPITADLVAAGLCGVIFSVSLPDSWVWEGLFYLFI